MTGGTPELSRIAAAAAGAQLDIMGAFHPTPGDGATEGCGTLLLLGPLEPGFWPHFTASPEWSGGLADPLDRWSERVIGALAETLEGTALYPFTGPPYHPFFTWALRCGTFWRSPVHLLVHERAGLFASMRGALALPRRLPLPARPQASPCESCAEKPCLAACPAAALTAGGYDTGACHAFLDTPAGASCMNGGCLVRRACPVSLAHGRLPEQSAYHMTRFHHP